MVAGGGVCMHADGTFVAGVRDGQDVGLGVCPPQGGVRLAPEMLQQDPVPSPRLHTKNVPDHDLLHLPSRELLPLH